MKEGVDLEIDKSMEEQLIQNLKDAGCEPETIIRFLQLCQHGKTSDQLCLLAGHRKTLLYEIHSEQSKLDCLDYLIYQLKKTTKNKKAGVGL